MKKRFAVLAVLLINCSVVLAQSGQPQSTPQTAASKESSVQRAEAILRQAREAKGGEEKLKQITDLTYNGDYITYDNTGNQIQPLTMFLFRAQKVRTDVGINSNGFDGKTAWFNDAPQTGRGAYETRRRAIREWFINLLTIPDNLKMSAIALPDSELNNQPVAVIEFEIGECKFKISFDKQTYLARRLSYGMMNGTEEIEISETQEDYKTVSGIKFAHRQIGLEQEKPAGEVVVKEYKINSGIDPMKFTHK